METWWIVQGAQLGALDDLEHGMDGIGGSDREVQEQGIHVYI